MKLTDNIKTVDGKTDSRFNFAVISDDNGVEVISVTVDGNEAAAEKYPEMTFHTDNGDAYSVWSPMHQYKRALYPDWRRDFRFDTGANNGIPLMQFLDKKGNNICLFAVADFVSQLNLKGGIDERSGKISVSVTVKRTDLANYGTEIYFDRRRIPYYEAVADYHKYLQKLGFSAAPVPDFARRRTYSTWYAFQKGITQDEVYKQCMLAKEYGMNTVIIDDGWQTPVNTQHENAYITAGDWEPYTPKFPDMKGLVENLHAKGMKVVLWIATPYIGSESKCFRFFNGRFLGKNRADGTVMVADPRYADIRKWYVDLLTDRMVRWKLDGFKLDFINNFTLTDESRTDFENMDYPVLGEAVTALLDEITSALRKINPDVMIEYRQTYIGPAMQKSGNLFRVEDCAYGAMFNRINGIDLRLAAPHSAIHSDMLMWDYEASAEAAADQLSALLFITPQISMFFDKLPEEHRKVLKFYLDYIDSNTAVLQYGKMVPLNPEAFYPVVYAENNGKVIAGLYCANSFRVPDGAKSLDIVNAAGSEYVYIDFADNDFSSKEYVIYNCMGDVVGGGVIKAALQSFNVPHNGIIMIH